MGYYDYLKELLRPLGVYSLDSGYGAAELYALGEGLDRCCGKFQEAERECLIPTAEEAGLLAYEEIVPSVPAYTNAATRRNALMGLIQTDGTCFTRDALCRILSGCGVSALVDETGQKYTVAVSFPNIRGVPENIEEIKERVEMILPCHLDVTYVYSFAVWAELEGAYHTWAELENETWSSLESWGGTE